MEIKKENTGEFTSSGVNKDKIVDVLLAEYNVLRSEISLYHQHQKLAVNYALLTTVAFITAFLTIVEKNITIPYVRYILLVFPIFISIIGITYLDKTVRIKRIASYISSCIRPMLIEIFDGYHVLHWEMYKRVTSELREKTYQNALYLDRFRGLIFLFPMIASYGIYIYGYWPTTADKSIIIDVILVALNTLFMAEVIKAYSSVEETKGAEIDGSHIFDAVIKKSNDVTIKSKEFYKIFGDKE